MATTYALAMKGADRSERLGISVNDPAWLQIEARIERLLKHNGYLIVEAVATEKSLKDFLLPKELIIVELRDNELRVIVKPEIYATRNIDTRGLHEIEYKYFNGVERYKCEEWDARTVFKDISTVKQVLKGFFDNRGITRAIIDNPLLVWDLRPYTLQMSASDGLEGVSVHDPVWCNVERRIERAFNGGHVRLEAGVVTTLQGRSGLFPKESIGMQALPGRFRIIVSPEEEPRQKTNLREWWQPKDSPSRGTDRFGDDEWDSRTVCTDISVAKEMFKDFFDNRGITEAIMRQTLSVWDRKPR